MPAWCWCCHGQAGAGIVGIFFSPRFVPDCEALSVPRGRSGPFPGGNWSPITRFTRQVTDRHVPYTESTHRNKKELNKYT